MVAGLTVLLTVGLALTAAGLRGRRTDDHPLCRQCRFNLTGRSDTVEPRCPECGADLTRPRATVVGHRQRRAGVLAGGLVLLALSLTAGGVAGYLRARQVDWLARAPLWYVIRQARAADPALAAQWDPLGSGGTRPPALLELVARARGGRLSDRQWSAATHAALAYQADPSQAWFWEWGDVIVAARLSGHLSDADWQRYGRQAVWPGMFVLQVSPTAGRERVVTCDLLVGKARVAWFTRSRWDGVRIVWPDGIVIRDSGVIKLFGPVDELVSTRQYPHPEACCVPPAGLGPGPQTIRATGVFQLAWDGTDDDPQPAAAAWPAVPFAAEATTTVVGR